MDDPHSADDFLPESGKSSWVFRAALLLFGSYAAFLIVLALSTANPILFSPRQLKNSPLIVRGKIEKIEDRGITFNVEELYRGKNAPERLQLRGLDPKPLAEGQEWVLPLSIVGDQEFRVTPLSFDSQMKQAPLIYPADPATIANLKSRLSSGELSP